MEFPRVMGFVDGENLVMRYQAMVDSGFVPKKDIVHVKDTFVWHPDATNWSMFDFIRINYYTSSVGDAPKLDALRDTISGTGYSYSYTHDEVAPAGAANLIPHVFHRPSKNGKARNVDLQISIDVLRAAHLSSVDILLLFSGDGDYVPLVQEAARFGKEIWIAAFSSGLNPRLGHHADVFQSLDELFFRHRPKT